MNFVKSGVYLQEITEKGIKEQEIDTRDPREREREERLRKLPEFTNDPNFKSLAEQLEENEQAGDPEDYSAHGESYQYAPPKVTIEEAEFLDSLESEQLKKKQRQTAEEEHELELFRQSISSPNHNKSVIIIENREKDEDNFPVSSPRGSTSEPTTQKNLVRAAIVIKKKKNDNDGTQEQNIITTLGKTDTTTKNPLNKKRSYDHDEFQDSSFQITKRHLVEDHKNTINLVGEYDDDDVNE